ncbi:MAG: Rrf2 family transcriptional regulator [Planctomycetales bacterium]|nr:Rrf2 family transcriptional regulator [Planctomycetales bacterium]
MQLSLQTDYAVRTLMYLAARQERATIDDVASFYGISRAHIAKVVNQLARLGFVRSIRGVGGGLELGRAPEELSIGAVIVAFEGPMHLLDCVGMSNVCAIEKFCKLKGVLAEAERLQLEYLNSISLADVVPTKRQLTKAEIPS